MTVRVRFAPSPTGKLHIGHLRAAIPNFLFAKRHGGTFIVRMEDTDMERNVEGAEELILDDLAWLGMVPEESFRHGGEFGPYRTIDRAERGDYTDAVQKLMDAGRAYECFVTQQELDVMRKLQRSRNEPPHYDNRHRDLSDAEKEKFRAEGRTPVIRFKLEGEEIKYDDIVRGEVKFGVQHLGGDPVIVRSNGVPLFTLGGVVDDINQKITHVIRGEDHVANTAIQVQIFEALGEKMPAFAHSPMLLDKDGHKFSKRRGSASVAELREKGYLPQAVVAYMAGLGFSEIPEDLGMESLAEAFPVEGMGRAAVRFDEEQLARTNANMLHRMNFAEAEGYLEEYLGADAVCGSCESFWNVVRENIGHMSEVKHMYDICFGEIAAAEMDAEDVEYISAAAECLPSGEYTRETWSVWIGEIKAKTGRKGKGLFMPLRLALTGENHGPELADLLPLMGEELAKARLSAVVEARNAA